MQHSLVTTSWSHHFFDQLQLFNCDHNGEQIQRKSQNSKGSWCNKPSSPCTPKLCTKTFPSIQRKASPISLFFFFFIHGLTPRTIHHLHLPVAAVMDRNAATPSLASTVITVVVLLLASTLIRGMFLLNLSIPLTFHYIWGPFS